jgi:hypothetical protein
MAVADPVDLDLLDPMFYQDGVLASDVELRAVGRLIQ